MATQAIAAFGIALKRNGTVVPELTSVGDVGASLAIQDVTAHDGSGWVERIGTLLDGGTIPVQCNFVPGNAQHVGMRTDMTSKALQAWTVVLPGGSPTWAFSGYVTQYRIPSAPVNGHLQLQAQIMVSGAVTFA